MPRHNDGPEGEAGDGNAPSAWDEVLARERAAIREPDGQSQGPGRALTGLAFSGGGIRSATFNLGILQALAELRLLRHFDYLSCVSGGGYIGGWLSALIHRECAGRVEDAEERLRTGGVEAPAIGFLRSYSNYLTPRANFLSPDTLAAVATYLRNLYLNLALLLLGLAALLLLPRLLVRGIRWLAAWHGVEADLTPLLGGGVAALMLGMLSIGFNFSDGPRHARPFYARPSGVLALVVAPVTVSAWFIAYAFYAGSAHLRALPLGAWAAGGAVIYTLPWALGWCAGYCLCCACRGTGPRPAIGPPRAALAMGLYTLLAGALGGLLLAGVAELMAQFRNISHMGHSYRGSWPVSALGTALVLAAYSLAVVGHIGLMGRRFSHDFREWWSRLGGLLLLVAVCWATLFSIVFGAPAFFRWAHDAFIAAGGITWAVSTLAGVMLGRSAGTAGDRRTTWRDRAAQCMPYVFILGLLGLLSLGLHHLLTLAALCPDCVRPASERSGLLPAVVAEAPNFKRIDVRWVGLLFGACVAGTLVLARRLDVNLFSIYYFYRLRLTRCYLGASRGPARAPHPFTGFDPRDDLELAALATTAAEPGRSQRPYPIHNTAMNLVAGRQLAWQERRAAAFAFTPLASGYSFVLPEGQGDRVDRYRPTAGYMGGVWLGAAVAISGAAASPNMGYHSSPALTFLMTVFNVRLGHWSPNPGNGRTWTRHDPTFGGAYLLRELVGETDYDSPFVYLSDGGHFENLGIYELVRRRCACIVAVDAGQDPDSTFEDLGNAIRKCYADFGVVIDVRAESLGAGYVAVGRIRYPDASVGDLLYIKPRLAGSEPADLLSYQRMNPGFPHQSTADQWFDEAQFESYRKLGHHIGLAVFGPALETAAQRQQQEGIGPGDPPLPGLCAVLRERQDGAPA